jgi:hypothetical protein
MHLAEAGVATAAAACNGQWQRTGKACAKKQLHPKIILQEHGESSTYQKQQQYVIISHL